MILPVFTQVIVDRVVGQSDVGLLNTSSSACSRRSCS